MKKSHFNSLAAVLIITAATAAVGTYCCFFPGTRSYHNDNISFDNNLFAAVPLSAYMDS